MKKLVCSYIVIILLALFCLQSLVAQPAINFLGNINIPHGQSNTTYFSSCWGWVSPDGREYALLGTCNGTSIIDLNSDTLKEIQFIPGPYAGYCLREMKTWKQYAYIVTEGGGGVQIVDLSGLPDTAILIKNFIYVDSTVSPSGNTTYSHTVTISDGFLYLNGSRLWKNKGGAVIFSLLDDPTNPEYIGDVLTTYFHDTYVRNDTMYASAIYNSGEKGGLHIIDLSDKSSPSEITNISYPGSGTHNSWVSMDGKYVFTADEINPTPHNMKVWDISSLPLYEQAASWQQEPSSIVHNVHGRGNYVYVAHYTAGMGVVDVHDPQTPFTADWFDSYAGTSGGYAGCWGVYPYFPSGKWIGSDMQTGLYVFTFDSLRPRQRVRLVTPPDSGEYDVANPLLQWTSSAEQSSDPHFYELHIVGNGLDTAIQTKDTVLYGFNSPELQPGTYHWFVLTRDEFTEVSSVDTLMFYYPDINDVSRGNERISSFQLQQNYPNPFNPTTTLSFVIDNLSLVSLRVYDVLGKEVALLVNERLIPGEYEILWNAGNLPSGVYYYQLTVGETVQQRKMMYLR
ncbi:MAG: choice-of-anchor B family protein [Bacteroidetes bacterium]|nr:MAG: choice-of-anchor B family protein [Bacteroidota bacterium]